MAVTLLIACTREHWTLDLERQTNLLERPYPMNYPSSAPIPNKIISRLSPQRLAILSDSYVKDFHVYRVRDASGEEGYVIDLPGMREERRR
jgi:hypothetical protein